MESVWRGDCGLWVKPVGRRRECGLGGCIGCREVGRIDGNHKQVLSISVSFSVGFSQGHRRPCESEVLTYNGLSYRQQPVSSSSSPIRPFRLRRLGSQEGIKCRVSSCCRQCALHGAGRTDLFGGVG
jgi:hypothetical protein